MKLTPVATGISNPVNLKQPLGDSTRLFVLGQDGKIWIIKNGTLLPDPFLDISSITYGPVGGGEERGLLGLAFHPDYLQNGRFFVYYTGKETGGGSSGDQHLVEYARSANDPDHANPTATQTLFVFPDSESNHNGGSLEFSPIDGFLYVGLGDGGGGGDNHPPFGNGQNLASHWGKILRLDVSTTPYSIPTGNMTAIPAGNPTTGTLVGEIWDYGMRNPWRTGFDVCTGDFYIGDVGQGLHEEIDVEPAGQGNKNYGWRLMEGVDCYNPANGCDMTGITLPVATYQHSDGCAVIGGRVYRGTAIPALRGTYLYSDYCSGFIRSFFYSNGAATAPGDLTAALGAGSKNITAISQDNAGELYFVAAQGDILRLDPQ